MQNIKEEVSEKSPSTVYNKLRERSKQTHKADNKSRMLEGSSHLLGEFTLRELNQSEQ